MSIIQFLRILWARKLIIAATTLCCLLGAVVVMLVVPPRWEAHAQVLLNTLKPDPATGQVMAGPSERNYAATQIDLIKDYAVAGQVPPRIGWLTDPALLDAYNNRSKHDVRDYRHWLAQIIIDNTKANLLDTSNILQITYTAPNPTDAKTIAEDLREAYMNADLSLSRADALRDAQWNQDQAAKARVALDQAIAAETTYERQNGILMADSKTDVDTERLRALSAQGAPMMAITPAASSTPAMDQLAQVDATLAQDRDKLGPNHPEVQALEAKRNALKAIVAQQTSSEARSLNGAANATAAAQGAMNAQKAKILRESPKLGHLQQLQSDVDVKQEQYNRIMARIGDLQQQASVVTSALTSLGVATTSNHPAFPNTPLILGGALVLGLGVGFCLALLTEFLGRRVRSPEDLVAATQAPMFAIIPTGRHSAARTSPRWWSLRRDRPGSMVVPT